MLDCCWSFAQRAYEGRIAIALLLDPGNSQITPEQVPGVIHLPMDGVPPFRLLHAKVALDLTNQDLKSDNNLIPQACADLRAAWAMLRWLRGHFDIRVLDARAPGRQDLESESTTVDRWIARAIRLGKGLPPRFFDSRGTSLLAQLPELVRKHTSQSARKYLGLGSGFYQSSDSHNKIPSVLRNIVDILQAAELLTRRPDIDIFVNPKACQSVANSVPVFNHEGWKVRDAGQPEYFKHRRALHAEFIFSANHWDDSDLRNSAWLYLGSGNLTGPGFANKIAPQSGNLEAGVVFAPDTLKWHHARGIPPESVLTNLLPRQWDTDFSQRPGDLEAGSDMPDHETQFSAAPVAYFFWIVEDAIELASARVPRSDEI